MESVVATATSTFSAGWDIAGNFIALIILAALLFALGRSIGRGAFIAFAVALYAGYALFLVFPFTAQITAALGGTAMAASLASIALYVAATFASYLAIRKAAGGDYFTLSAPGLAALSILVAGFLLALAYHAFAISALYSYPPPLAHLFTPPQYFFWWFLAPLAGLIIFA